MQTLWQDLRYGARMLIKRPSFTLLAVLTLALGIGANATIFSLVNATLLRPLPVARPAELAAVYTADFSSTNFGTTSWPDYVEFRDHNEVFSGLAAYTMTPFSLSVGGVNERVFGEMVSGNYFDVLGVRPVQGRGFLPEEDRTPDTHPVAIISYKLWQQRFGGDPAAVGREVVLNGKPFTIVGVAPLQYAGLMRGVAFDLWVPMMMRRTVTGNDDRSERGNRSLFLMGRLKPGITLAQAQNNFNLLASQLYQAYPNEWANIRKQQRAVTLLPESQMRVFPEFRGPVLIFTALLMTMVGLVLLVACANVANLLLTAAAARRKELAVRLALGAGRGRLLRQMLTESVLLAALGGAGGLLLAAWGVEALMAFKPPAAIPIQLDLVLDWRVLGFTLAVALLTGVLCGLAPARAASRNDVVSALKDATGARRGGGRLRGGLVATQVALSLLLLITSGLFLRSLSRAASIDLGFNPNNLLAASMDLRLQGYRDEAGRQFYQRLLERIRALPDVEAASLSDSLPLDLGGMRNGITVEGYTPQQGEDMEVNAAKVSAGYFEALQIPVLRGRVFDARDGANGPGAVVINEAFARRFWRDEQPVGKRIQMGDGGSANWLEVVGVVRDGKYVTLGEAAKPFFYRSFDRSYEAAATLTVRTRGNPTDALTSVRRIVAGLDATLPLTDVKTMRQHLGLALLPARLAATILGIFGAVALLLATSGIYGVVAYSAAQRTQEIGIRMALGAQRRDVWRLIVGQGMKPVALGLGCGLALALIATRALQSQLYGVSAFDPWTFAAVITLLASIAVLACWLPARRAAKVDPMIALRCE